MRTAKIAPTRLVPAMPLAGLVLALLAAFALILSARNAFAAESSASAGGASAPGEAEGSEAPVSPSSEAELGTPSRGEEEAALNGVSLATWYGPGLFGRHTACGQVLTKQTVGVANRTLACGTLVEVTYAGSHATIPVIDRGPYGSLGANWDLTEGAAHLLHIVETVDVKTKIVGRTKNNRQLGLSATAAKRRRQRASGATGGASA
ncbi:MAG: septal ring lytic transglycosylase RlpA family protein [Solirubrobacteraceae bacterium]